MKVNQHREPSHYVNDFLRAWEKNLEALFKCLPLLEKKYYHVLCSIMGTLLVAVPISE